MHHLRIEECTDEVFNNVAKLFRAEDAEEWRQFTGKTPAELIADGYTLSRGTGCINRVGYHSETGAPLAIWGCNPMGEHGYDINNPQRNTGWVWLAATPEAVPVASRMHRHFHDEFDRMLALYPSIYTLSWDGNPLHQTWLNWLGFKQGTGLTLENGADFTAFTYRR